MSHRRAAGKFCFWHEADPARQRGLVCFTPESRLPRAGVPYLIHGFEEAQQVGKSDRATLARPFDHRRGGTHRARGCGLVRPAAMLRASAVTSRGYLTGSAPWVAIWSQGLHRRRGYHRFGHRCGRGGAGDRRPIAPRKN